VKLYEKIVPAIAREIVETLIENQDIEVEEEDLLEAQKDFESIMYEYIRKERDLSETTKNILAARGWSSTKYAEARKIAASAKGVPRGDEALEYMVNQMLEYMLISPHIAEVYAQDNVMRKRCVEIIRRHLKLNEQIEEEVRRRLKHLQEGTRDWEIAYRRALEQVRRNKGLI